MDASKVKHEIYDKEDSAVVVQWRLIDSGGPLLQARNSTDDEWHNIIKVSEGVLLGCDGVTQVDGMHTKGHKPVFS